jgi:membrane protein
VQSVIDNRGSLGVIALLGVAYAGLGWVGNLRAGVQMVWASEVTKENFVKAKLEDLVVLVGLGIGIVLSLALTSGVTSAIHAVLTGLHLDGIPGMGTLVGGLAILLALAADTVLFMWLFTRLPRRPVRYRTVLRGAIFAAVGYEVLKIVGTTYIASVTSNPTYGVFASAVGLLIWINLVSRYLLLPRRGPRPAGSPCGPDSEPDRRRRASPSRSRTSRPAGSSGRSRPAPGRARRRARPRSPARWSAPARCSAPVPPRPPAASSAAAPPTTTHPTRACPVDQRERVR